jgi:L,D-transpeptidase catalytic domain
MESDVTENQPNSPEPQTADQAGSARAGVGRHVGRWLGVLVAALVLAAVATTGYLVVMARASGSGISLPLAHVPGAPATSSTGSSPAPLPPHWIVARVRSSLKVLAEPSPGAKVLATVPAKEPRYGGDSVMLVRDTSVAGWYDVILPTPAPVAWHGWVRTSSVGMFVVTSRIVVDLSARTLSVISDNRVIAQFPVAVGMPGRFQTPTGNYFITEKVRATNPTGTYGPLAFALSAYKPQLAAQFPPLGQLAIHGWYDPSVVGKAVSHGCIRMRNADILKLSLLVAAGSPVSIQK